MPEKLVGTLTQIAQKVLPSSLFEFLINLAEESGAIGIVKNYLSAESKPAYAAYQLVNQLLLPTGMPQQGLGLNLSQPMHLALNNLLLAGYEQEKLSLPTGTSSDRFSIAEVNRLVSQNPSLSALASVRRKTMDLIR